MTCTQNLESVFVYNKTFPNTNVHMFPMGNSKLNGIAQFTKKVTMKAI